MTPRTNALPAIVWACAVKELIDGARQAVRTWGATPVEAGMTLPGDDLVPDCDGQTTMAIDIDAPPERVWPWLLQMGTDRAGLYSHTWVENGLLHLGVKNADTIVPEWQRLQVGDHIWFASESYPGPKFGPIVVRIEPNRALVCSMGDDQEHRLGSWQFVLEPCGESTRLLFRTRSSGARPLAAKVSDWMLEFGYAYMYVGMLNGIKQRSETSATQASDTAVNASREQSLCRTLVAFATRQGSTRQIANTVAAQLHRHGIDADACDVSTDVDLAPYDAIIFGSPIQNHHWLRQAQDFIDGHCQDWGTKQVWLFSVGMLPVDRGTDWPSSYPHDIDQIIQTTHARDHRLFLGRRQITEPKVVWRPLTKALHLAEGDFRDWIIIRAWADEIASALLAPSRRAAA